MGSEAMIPPRAGELRLADLRVVYGTALRSMSHVDVVVLDVDGGGPIAAHVELGDVRAGRGNHCAILCPACGAPKSLLLARRGALKCRACHGQRTRRALERHRADWMRRGGREEDQLLRAFQPARHLTPRRLEQARELAAALVAADEARVSDLQDRLFELCADAAGLR